MLGSLDDSTPRKNSSGVGRSILKQFSTSVRQVLISGTVSAMITNF